MTRKRFIILISVITCAVIAGLGLAQMVPRSVRPFTATVSEEHYSGGSNVSWFSFTETVAVRRDGSHVKARHISSPGDGKTAYRLVIADAPSKQTVVVDPISDSITTRPLQAMADKLMIKATSSCPGQPSGKLLGFNVNLEETHNSDGKFKRDVRAWVSPDLDCFPLRQETHFVAEDGREDFGVRSVSLLTQGDPPAWLFTVPTTYIERSPTQMLAEQARRYPQRYSQPDPSTHVLDDAYNASQRFKQ